MRAKLCGIQYVVKWHYQDKSGTNQRIHVMYPDKLEAPDQGFRVESIKVNNRVQLQGLHANDDIEIYFDRFGNVESVVKV